MGFADGQRAAARFNAPAGISLDVGGHLIVADLANDCIRKVTTAEGARDDGGRPCGTIGIR